jgi:hypothetical protein
MKDAVELPAADGEYWVDVAMTSGSRAVVDAILERRREGEEEGFAFTSRFLKLLTQESFEAFGHACSNAIKPAMDVDIDVLAQSLNTIRDGTLESIRKIPQYQYGAILTTAIDLTAQILDHAQQSEGEDPKSVFEAEILAKLPAVEA